MLTKLNKKIKNPKVFSKNAEYIITSNTEKEKAEMGIDFNAKVNSFDLRSIDTQNVSTVANQIFVNAQQKSAQVSSLSEKIDLSKFKKVDLGLEIYGHQISMAKVNQIAIRQSGIDVKLNQNVLDNIQYLNTQAAISANKDLSRNIAGKIHQQVNVNEVDESKQLFIMPSSSNIGNIGSLDKDKTGSNGTFTFQHKGKENGEKTEDSQKLSIFA